MLFFLAILGMLITRKQYTIHRRKKGTVGTTLFVPKGNSKKAQKKLRKYRSKIPPPLPTAGPGLQSHDSKKSAAGITRIVVPETFSSELSSIVTVINSCTFG